MSDVQKLSGTSLLELHEQKASEKAILVYSDAPLAELQNVQRSIDSVTQEIMRRLSW